MQRGFVLGAIAACGVAFSACGGGGSSGTPAPGSVEGLSIPSQVAIVDAQSTGGLNVRRAGTGEGGISDYQADATRFWIHDDSMEALDIVNEILCALDQTNYDDASVVNAGPYSVLVDCFSRGEQVDGREATEYERWVVESTRASNSAPHVVTFWIEGEADGPGDDRDEAIIYGRLTITEAASTANPYGKFDLAFKQLLTTQAHDDGNTLFQGYLRTVDRSDDQLEFVFYNARGDVEGTLDVGDWAMLHRTRLVGNPGDDSGQAFAQASFAENHGGTTFRDGTQYFVQFNADYLARKTVDGGSAIQVFDRSDFDTYVYRYGIYEADSECRVDQVSGFGLETEAGDHGWVDYYGMWFPDHVTIADGQTLVRRARSAQQVDESYTAVLVAGRLEKETKEDSTLGNVANEDLGTFDPNRGTEILVRWTGTDLVAVAEFDHQQGVFSAIEPPESVVTNYTAGQWLHFWSDARGDISFEWPVGSLSDTTPIFVSSRETITGDSPDLANGDLTLHGYWDMMRADITQAQANWQANASPFFPDATIPSEGREYVFDAETLLLTIGGDPCTIVAGASVGNGPSRDGIWSGALFPSAVTSFSQFGTMDTNYVWSTGPNDWNQLRMIKDEDDEFVAFAPPLRLSYTHDDPSDPDYDGKAFRLEWQGFDLHGIPFIESSEDRRWYPAFNIPTGTLVEDGEENRYLIKQLEGEQLMSPVANPNAVITAQGFDLDTTLEPPAEDYRDPAIGPMPSVTEPPLFIGGAGADESEG